MGSTLTHCVSNVYKHIILFFEQKSKTIKLLLCFQKPFIRFHLLSDTIETKNEHTNQPLEGYLSGMFLKSIETINNDRIVQFHFSSESKNLFLICEFFSKHPNYYITDAKFNILYAFHPSRQLTYQFPASNSPLFSQKNLLSHAEIEKYYSDLEKSQTFGKEKKLLENKLKKKLKKMHARKVSLDQSIENCKNWESVQHEGDLIKANLNLFKKGQLDIVVQDWLSNQSRTIQVNPKLTPQEEMTMRFQRARKLHRGLTPLMDQKKKINQKIEIVEKQLEELTKISSLPELERKKNQILSSETRASPLIQKQKASLPYHAFQSTTGMQIWVGKNAKANEKLTFQAANGHDWWLHVQGSPGSHVIIKTNKGQPPDPDTLQDAMQLALFYSKAKEQGGAEVCVTQRKYVSRFGKGQSGKVQISKHSTNWVNLDIGRYKRIKERKNQA